MKKASRREFLKGAATAAIGAPFVLRTLPALAEAAGKKLHANATVKRRRLGRTELMISEVGFGGHYKNPDRTYRIASIERALDRGINFLDCFEAEPSYREIQMVGDALDEGVGLQVGYPPFGGDQVAIPRIGLDHPGGIGHKEGHHCTRAGKHLLGPHVTRLDDALQLAKASVGRRSEAHQRPAIAGDVAGARYLVHDGLRDELGQFH